VVSRFPFETYWNKEWPTPDGRTAQLCHVDETRAFKLFIAIVGVTISVDHVLNYGFRLPFCHYIGQPCSWTICLQLSVASFQWDYGSNDGLASPLQMLIAVRFVPAVCPDSRKPPRELLWKTDPKRPLMDLGRRLAESIGGIPLKQSGAMPCPSTDASLPVLVRRHGADCLILNVRSWPV